MDLGLSRFLEMFEERFGRTATTAILGAIGVAAMAWAIQTVIQLAVYIYKLAISTHLLTALETESILFHSLFFAAQFAITFFVLGFLWRKFAELRMKSFKTWTEREMGKISERFDLIKKNHADMMRLFELHKDAVDKGMTAMQVIQRVVEEKIAENPQIKSLPTQPHPNPEPQVPPETK
jgi:hypothetical protein